MVGPTIHFVGIPSQLGAPSRTTAASDRPVPWSQTTPGIRGGERRVIPRLASASEPTRSGFVPTPEGRTGRCNRISQHPTYLTENYNSPATNFESRKRPTVDIANFLPRRATKLQRYYPLGFRLRLREFLFPRARMCHRIS